eukprot:Blabericola_migrator_1__11633@NODE_6_length_26506_cov_44_936268_g5_i0_p1_GENE_NODE_6_length_26506_cov_44_936268_g5_i0NODE_6_length_26506_cov_44_936268_g5_i0_p1_ORF_typecomplete_len7931_score1366_80ketoacylsynt/PF00109_26/5_6e73ketoacylsynt/PF00109_26/1_5e75ketoacylsynt/PF00109_26/1_2e70ketoacylsynt/PF00109_26/3_7e59Ketoacylsynt_C/PF02801_22/5_4e33Ketoacylsynt_C/PF02801_22/5_1e43Ketoacylsynt_C/PF02801_22/2e38Ketoacylsynt_C/PF02801_22/2e24Acyl_transf_1/PF00698_21/5e55Acyl_transf_1/PF00698_21/6_9e7
MTDRQVNSSGPQGGGRKLSQGILNQGSNLSLQIHSRLPDESPTSSQFVSPMNTYRKPSWECTGGPPPVTRQAEFSRHTSFNLAFYDPTAAGAPSQNPFQVGVRIPPSNTGISQKIETRSPVATASRKAMYSSSPKACHPKQFEEVSLEILWNHYGTSNNPWGYQVKNWAVKLENNPAYVWLNASGMVTDTLTFSGLARKICHVADYMRNSLGLHSGDRVVLCYPPSLDFIPAFFACLCSGVIAIPVYPPDPLRAKADCSRFLAICESAAVSHILTNKLYRRVAAILPTLYRDTRWTRLTWCDYTNYKPARPIVVSEYEFPSLTPDGVAFLQYTSGSTGQPKGVMVTVGGLLHNAYLCCASFGFPTCLDDPTNTSSLDECPFIEFEDWLHQIRLPLHRMARGHDIRTFSWLPVYHDMGLIGFVIVPFLFGGSSYQMSPVDFIKKPHLWLDCISKYRCSCTAAPNFAFELSCRKMPEEVYNRLDLSHVCGLLCGAEPLRLSTVQKFLQKYRPKGLRDWAFKPAYGLAENTLIVTGSLTYSTQPRVLFVDSVRLRESGEVVSREGHAVHLRDLPSEDVESSRSDSVEWVPFISCGRPKQSVDVCIVDAETRQEVPEGRVGEIWIRSASLARGYFNCPEETQETFGNVVQKRLPFASEQSSGFFLRSGDAGFKYEDNLYVVGRIKDMLILRGRNYFPQDIESLVEELPELRSGCSACFPIEVAGEERCGLAVELKESDTTVKSGIRAKMTSVIKGTQFNEEKVEELAKSIRRIVGENLSLDIAALWLCKPKTLPKTSSGKVRRSLARETLLSGALASGVLHAPSPNILAQVEMPGSRMIKSNITGQSPSVSELPESCSVASEEISDPIPPPPPEVTITSAENQPPVKVQNTFTEAELAQRQERRKFVRECIVTAARESIGVEDFDDEVFDRPLFELGVDSIGAITFVEALSNLVDRELDTTLLFEFPTLADIEDYLCDEATKHEHTLQSTGGATSINAPLFVFGAACRFPGASKLMPLSSASAPNGPPPSTSEGLEKFWKNLYDGVDCISEVPLDRWNIDAYWTQNTEPLQAGKIYTRGGGFIEDAEWFDHGAFRLAAREAQQMDPQQKLALECCSEAIWNAGLTEPRVKHRRIGTYFGCCSSDWSRLRPVQAVSTSGSAPVTPTGDSDMNKSISVYTSAAYAPSLIANRVSFVFGLTGPSVVIDTACSSSLVALDSAAHHLQDGKCEAALVGGVNLMLTPEVPSMLCKANMLSRDSRCKTFDVRADGYSRGEGVGCIFISPDINLTHKLLTTNSTSPKLSRPITAVEERGSPRDLPPPLAIIRSVAVNHGGVAAALTAPNVNAHQELLAAAVLRARVSPKEVEFIETHGTGTKLGDPVELAAIRAVYARGRAFEFPLVLGAVKTGVGHLEGAAGIAGLLKAIAVLRNKAVPKNLHLKELNPQLPVDNLPFLFPNETYALSDTKERHFAALSSFGFGGTNAHAILQRFEHTEHGGRETNRMARTKIWHRTAAPFRPLIPPMIGSVEEEPEEFKITTHLRTDVTHLLAEHVIQEVPVMPGAAILEFLREVYATYCRHVSITDTSPCHLQTVEIERPIILTEIPHTGPPKGLPPVALCATLKKSTGQLTMTTVYQNDSLSNAQRDVSNVIARLNLSPDKSGLVVQCSYQDCLPNASDTLFPVEDFYKVTKDVGLSLGQRFRAITGVWRRESTSGFLAEIRHVESQTRLIRGEQMERAFFLHPAMLDGIMQIASLSIAANDHHNSFFVPIKMEGVYLDSFSLDDVLRCYAVCSKHSERDGEVRVSLFSESTKKCVVHIQRLVMAQVSFSVPVDIPRQCLWRVEWEALEPPSTAGTEVVSEPTSEITEVEWDFGTEVWGCVSLGGTHTCADRYFPSEVVSSFVTLHPDECFPKLEAENTDENKAITRVLVLFDAADFSNTPTALPGSAISSVVALITNHKRRLSSNAWILFISSQPEYFEQLAALRRCVEYEWLAAGFGYKPITLLFEDTVAKPLGLAEVTNIFDRINKGDTELLVNPSSMATSISPWLKAPRLRPVSSESISGSLLELSVDVGTNNVIKGLKCRPCSSATRRMPRPGEIEVAIKCFAFLSGSEKTADHTISVSKSIFGAAKVYFSGVVCRDADAPQAEGQRNYPVGSRITGVWVQTTTSPALRSVLCLPIATVSDQFIEDVSFEAAVVDSILGFPDSSQQSMMREYTELSVTEPQALAELKPSAFQDNEVVLLKFPSPLKPAPDSVIDPANEAVIITGGHGALGLRVAEWLVGEGALNVILLSRRGTAPSEVAANSSAWSLLMSNRILSNVRCISCDVTSLTSLDDVISKLCVKNQLKVIGIIHAAGVLRDKPMNMLTSKDIDDVVNVKLLGLHNLHEMCAKYGIDEGLKFFTAFSSAAAVFGNVNQSVYAMANAGMKQLMAQRRARGLVGNVIEWGPWMGDGMAANLEGLFSRMGVRGISTDLGLRVLADSLMNPSVDCTCIPLDPASFLQSRPRKWNFYEQLQDEVQKRKGGRKLIPAKLARMSETELYASVRQIILETASKVIGKEGTDFSSIPTDVPLTDAGVDSLAAVEFRDEVTRQLGIDLSVSAMFDYPALDNLIDYVYELMRSELGSNVSDPVKQTGKMLLSRGNISDRAADGYGVMGMACRMPPGGAVADFWQMMCEATDCVIEMPLSRFNLDTFYSPDMDKSGCAYVRGGAFMKDVDLFDNHFFGISDAEAKLMDPQQRLMLEVTYDAVVDAGLDAKAMRKQYKDTAVYIGCCNFDWHYMDSNNNPKSGSPFSCTGGSMSLVSNRISYAFGLNGPSMTIDTACSSSLVALDAGREKLDSGNGSGLIVGGANLMLSPQLFIGFCKTRLLSPDCACRTLDHRANGYVRGEGVAAIFLLPMCNISKTESRRVYAVVKGSATNHVGRGSTLTAPNGPLQAACLKEALERSGKMPSDVGYLEMHGTGTEIGDPIEAGAIKAVYRDRGDTPLYMGAVKTNIGHLEGAAGVAGLIKAILVLHHRKIPPNLHFEKLSPHVDFTKCNFIVPSGEVLDLPQVANVKVCAAVSGFGFGGANAHVVIESVQASIEDQTKQAILFFTGQGSAHPSMGSSLRASSKVFASTLDDLEKIYVKTIHSEEFQQAFPDSGCDVPLSLLDLIYRPSHSPLTSPKLQSQPKPPRQDCELQELETDPIAAQVSVVMFELAVLSVLKTSQDIVPYAMLGHSIGEFAMLAALEILTAEEVIELVTWRAALIKHRCLFPDQLMVACKSSRAEVQNVILKNKWEDHVAVAADNGAQRVVVSGSAHHVHSVLGELGLEESAVKKLTIPKAYHSPFMQPAREEWNATVKRLLVSRARHISPSKITIYSTVEGRPINVEIFTSVDYWNRHLMQTVLFRQCVEELVADLLTSEANRVVIEVGPKAHLMRMATSISPGLKTMLPCHDIETDPTLDSLKERITRGHRWNRRKHGWIDGPYHPTAGQGQKQYNDTIQFKTYIRRDATDFFREHMIGDSGWMPATGYLDMISAQTAQLNSKKWRQALTKIDRLEFLQPSTIPTEVPKREDLFKSSGEIVVVYQADGSFEVKHTPAGAEEDEKERLVCTGRVLLKAGVTENHSRSPATSPRTELADNGETLLDVKSRLAVSALAAMTSQSQDLDATSSLLTMAREALSQGDGSLMFDILAQESKSQIDNLYKSMAKLGLKYQPRFQIVQQIVWSDCESVALCVPLTWENLRSRQPPEIAKRYRASDFEIDSAFRWHPAMLDGAFQAVAPLFRSSNCVYVPSAIRHAYLRSVMWSEILGGYWTHSKLLRKDDSSLYISVTVYSTTGDKLAFISDVRFKKLSLTPPAVIPQNLLWTVTWKELAKTEKERTTVRFAKRPSSSSLIPDSYWVYRVPDDENAIEPCPKSTWIGLLTGETPLVFVCTSLVEPRVARSANALAAAYGSIIALLQCCFEAKPRLSVHIIIVGYALQGIQGFTKATVAELAQSHLASRVSIQGLELDPTSSLPVADAVRLLLEESVDKRETLVRLALHQPDTSSEYLLFVPRIERHTPYECFGWTELWMSSRGALSNLRVRPQADESRLVPSAEEIEIAVLAVGLNFRDVLNVMDLYPGDPGLPGADCAGIVARIGPGCSRFKPGDAVFGLAAGSLKSFVTTSMWLVGHMPEDWSFEEASALPVAQVTVEYAFSDIAKLDAEITPIDDSRARRNSTFAAARLDKQAAGQLPETKPKKVLIHAATGGVGLFAIQYCKRIGAEIYCTVGSDFKKAYLESCGIINVSSSRDSQQFKTDLETTWFQDQSKHQFDAVLNCLSGDFIPLSAAYLKPGGFFLELGKLRTWTLQQMDFFRPDIHYHLIAVDHMIERDHVWFTHQLDRAARLCTAGKLRPIVINSFPATKGQDGFRFLQKARHIGKVVLTFPHVIGGLVPPPPDPEATTEAIIAASKAHARRRAMLDGIVMITGGTGGLGSVITESLVCDMGIKHILLLSRSGKTASQNLKPSLISAQIEHVKCDISDPDEVRAVFKQYFDKPDAPRLMGLIHAAGVLEDISLRQMTEAQFAKVLSVKINCLDVFDEQLAKYGLESTLSFYVLFSSIASLLGNASQTNYATANAILDAYAEKRRAENKVAVSIQWGPWLEQGMAMTLKDKLNMPLPQLLNKVGLRGISNALGLRVLTAAVVNQADAVIGVEPIRWKQFLSFYDTSPALFTEVAVDYGSGKELDKLSRELMTMSPEALHDHVFDVVVNTAIEVSGRKVEDGLDLDQPITESGIDSLAAVEFGNELSAKLGIKLSPTTLFDYPTLNGIAGYVYERIVSSIGDPATTATDLLEGDDGGLIMGPDQSPLAERPISKRLKPTQLGIIGAACRMPKDCWTLSAFWEMILNKTDCVSYIPETRFDVSACYDADPMLGNRCYVREGAFMDNVALFDNKFFNISPAEVVVMDPQQRVFLEVAYECLLDARYNRKTCAGKCFGVYVGCCNFDWHTTDATSRCDSTFSSTGIATSIVANRVSYALGLIGPSLVVDTACSSSLVALEAAINHLSADETLEGSIVGGVNVIAAPHAFVAFCKTRMLAPDGRCKTFDVAADGYGRGEGSGAIFIMPLKKAKGRRVHAVIRGAAVNHDGKSASLTAPNGRAQRACLASALARSGVSAQDVVYLESHGTGTALGDPIECSAIRAIYLDGVRGDNSAISPLVLGALKTNIGHLEGAAGIAGLLKALLVLKNRLAPPLVHFNKLNPHIKFDGVKVIVPKEIEDLEVITNRLSRANPRFCAAVSSFGFGGANSHVILEEPSLRMAHWSEENMQSNATGSIAYLFTGQGSQYVNMGRKLYDSEPVFQVNVDYILRLFGDLGAEVKEAWMPPAESDPELLNRTTYAQIALFTLEYGLYKLLTARGLEAHMVIGHSLGEFLSAVVCGIMSVEQAVILVKQRALIMGALDTTGLDPVMCAVRVGEEEAIKAVSESPSVSIASINGAKSIVLSGPRPDVAEALVKMNQSVEKARFLSVSSAFHSPMMQPARDQYHAFLNTVSISPSIDESSIAFISTVTGKRAQHTTLVTAEYWADQIIRPVRFADAMTTAGEMGATTFIEIGPKPTLMNMGRLALHNDESVLTQWACCLSPQQDDVVSIDNVVSVVKGEELHVWKHQSFPWDPVGRGSGHETLNLFAPRRKRRQTEPIVTGEREEVKRTVHLHILAAAEQTFPGVIITDFELPIAEALAGVDSLAAVEFREKLSESLDIDIPFTILFDYATLKDMEDALVSQVIAHNVGPEESDASGLLPMAPPPAQEALAIIGVGCSFPKQCRSPLELWEAMRSCASPFEEIPPERYNRCLTLETDPSKLTNRQTNSCYAALVEDPGVTFPSHFFHAQSKEMASVDPQQRLAMRCAYEAFSRAGLDLKRLCFAECAVFVGCSDQEWQVMSVLNGDQTLSDVNSSSWSFTGAAQCMMANRISHTLKLKGPSMTVDTGCSSFVSALSLSGDTLLRGRAELCLSVGVSLILSPVTAIGFSQMRYLTADKEVPVFDASAAGTLRGEGCGAFVLKRLTDALSAEDQIYGCIRAVAVNAAGGAPTLTAFHTPAHEEVIRDALYQSRTQPTDVDFVEAHATGIPIGDAVEFSALKQIFAKSRWNEEQQDQCTPLIVTSPHPYLGHSNGALGAAQLLKALLSIHFCEVPRLIKFTKPHPFLDLKKFPVKFAADSPIKLRTSGRPLVAMINSFGMGGANGSIILSAPTAHFADRWGPLDDPAYTQAPVDTFRWTNPDALLALTNLNMESPSRDLAMLKQYFDRQELTPPVDPWRVEVDRSPDLVEYNHLILPQASRPNALIVGLIKALETRRFQIHTTIAIRDNKCVKEWRRLFPKAKVTPLDPSGKHDNSLFDEYYTSVYLIPSREFLNVPYTKCRGLLDGVIQLAPLIVGAREIVLLSSVLTVPSEFYKTETRSGLDTYDPQRWDQMQCTVSHHIFGGLWQQIVYEELLVHLSKAATRRLLIVREGLPLDEHTPINILKAVVEEAASSNFLCDGADWLVTNRRITTEVLSTHNPNLWDQDTLCGLQICIAAHHEAYTKQDLLADCRQFGLVPEIKAWADFLGAHVKSNESSFSESFSLLAHRTLAQWFTHKHTTQVPNVNITLDAETGTSFPKPYLRIASLGASDVTGNSLISLSRSIEERLTPESILDAVSQMPVLPNGVEISAGAKAVVEVLVSRCHSLSLRGMVSYRPWMTYVARNLSLVDHLLTSPNVHLPELVQDPVFVIGADRFSNMLVASLITSDTRFFTTPSFGETLIPFGVLGAVDWSNCDFETGLAEVVKNAARSASYVNDQLDVVRSIVGDEFASLFPDSEADGWEDTLLLEMLGLSPSYLMKFGVDHTDYIESNLDYRVHRVLLKVLMYRRQMASGHKEERRLVLTSPYHHLALASLLSAYPSAKLIYVPPSNDVPLQISVELAERFQTAFRVGHKVSEIHRAHSVLLEKSNHNAKQILKGMSREERARCIFVLDKTEIMCQPREVVATLRHFLSLKYPTAIPSETFELIHTIMLDHIMPGNLDTQGLNKIKLISRVLTGRKSFLKPCLPFNLLRFEALPWSQEEWEGFLRVCMQKRLTSTIASTMYQRFFTHSFKGEMDPRAVYRRVLDQDIQNLVDLKMTEFEPGRQDVILITGATGFFGRYLLSKILSVNDPVYASMKIVCIVRRKGDLSGRQRVEHAFKESGLDASSLARIEVIEGDLAIAQFGWSQATYTSLASKAGIIFHAAGQVQMLSDFHNLYHSNILATLHLLQFIAVASRPKLHFVSSQAVFPGGLTSGPLHLDLYQENVVPQCMLSLPDFEVKGNGYAWTKQLSEVMCRQASELLGFDLAIYRLPHVYLAQDPPFVNMSDMVMGVLMTVLHIGVISERNVDLMDTVAVEDAAALMVEIARQPDAMRVSSLEEQHIENAYHLCRGNHPSHFLNVEDIQLLAKIMGINLRVTDDEEVLTAALRDKVTNTGYATYYFASDKLPTVQEGTSSGMYSSPSSYPLANTKRLRINFAWKPATVVWGSALKFLIKGEKLRRDSAALSFKARDICHMGHEALKQRIELREKGELPTKQHSALTELKDENLLVQALEIFRRDIMRQSLSSFAWVLAKKMAVQWYYNQLFMQDVEREHPEILHLPITPRPVFILGLNRSGTTFLYHAMSSDRDIFRAPLMMEMMIPYGIDGSFELPESPIPREMDPRFDPRKDECEISLQFGAIPQWTAFHVSEPHLPEEDYLIFEHAGRCFSISTAFPCPTYLKWLTADGCACLKEGYAVHKRFLQHLQAQRETPRWLIKGPFHMATLDALFETYPDATVIYIERDPLPALISWLNLTFLFKESLKIDQSNREWALTKIQDQIQMLKRYQAFCEDHPEIASERIIEVKFADLTARPKEVIKELYERLGESFSTRTESVIDEYLCTDTAKRQNVVNPYKKPLDFFQVTEEEIRALL